ncbi:MAG: PLP-dependent transferase [Burkholderiaceae bacterium]|nr:PLP-dependent transferase [Burkholderiaceae bacterium]
MSDRPQTSAETLVAQGGGRVAEPYREIVEPIHVATTYERAPDGGYPGGAVYSRDQNPAYRPAEEMLCALEDGRAALLFASGMSAAAAVFRSLDPGMRVVAPHAMYWALRNWLIAFGNRWGIEVDFYEPDDAELEAQLELPADLVWLETPANPSWEVMDIARAATAARRAGARLVVDSTVATPVFTQPLALGADLVMHSATKYLNGHSDVVAGALVTRDTDAFWDRICLHRAQEGAVPGPFEAWLLARGMRTLFPRLRQASASAARIADAMAAHPAIGAVLYPGRPDFPGHVVASAQMQGGFGAMLSIRVRGGEEAARQVASRLSIFKRATSLGSTESLVEHRASVEGPGTRCPDDLLRLSVGIELVDDLIDDLEQALAGIRAGG